jgi:hypothetical protein
LLAVDPLRKLLILALRPRFVVGPQGPRCPRPGLVGIFNIDNPFAPESLVGIHDDMGRVEQPGLRQP